MIEYKKWRKMLIIGMICSFITTALGDMPIAWVIYPETGNKLLDIILSCDNLSVLQMACSVFFGAVFIPLQYYGLKAIAEIISKTVCTHCAQIIDLGARAYAFGGGTVHVLCVAAMFLCKTENASSLTHIPQSVVDFGLYLLLPFSVVFIVFYLSMSIAIAIPIFKGKTIFPKWAVIFNPLTGKIVLNLLDVVGPNTKFFNGIRMGNMGVGSLMTFAAFYILLPRKST
jgi:hypothetical protein